MKWLIFNHDLATVALFQFTWLEGLYMTQLTQNFLRKLIYSEAEYKYNISFDCLSYLIILGAGQLVIENFDMEDQNQDFSRLIAFLIWEIDFFFYTRDTILWITLTRIWMEEKTKILKILCFKIVIFFYTLLKKPVYYSAYKNQR